MGMKRTLSIFVALHAVDIAAALWGLQPAGAAPIAVACLLKTACLLCAMRVAREYRVQQILARVSA